MGWIRKKISFIQSMLLRPICTIASLSRSFFTAKKKVWSDSACQSEKKAIRKAVPKSRDMANKHRARYNPLSDVYRLNNHTKSKSQVQSCTSISVHQKDYWIFLRSLSRNDEKSFVVRSRTSSGIYIQSSILFCEDISRDARSASDKQNRQDFLLTMKSAAARN